MMAFTGVSCIVPNVAAGDCRAGDATLSVLHPPITTIDAAMIAPRPLSILKRRGDRRIIIRRIPM